MCVNLITFSFVFSEKKKNFVKSKEVNHLANGAKPSPSVISHVIETRLVFEGRMVEYTFPCTWDLAYSQSSNLQKSWQRKQKVARLKKD